MGIQMIRLCNGDHGKLGMVGCLDPIPDPKSTEKTVWVCGASVSERQAYLSVHFEQLIIAATNQLVDEAQAVLDACWNEELFGREDG